MPFCGYLDDARIDYEDGLVWVRFSGPCDPEELDISRIIARAFPDAAVGELQVDYQYDVEQLRPSYVGQVRVYQAPPSREIEPLLKLLMEHITVVDGSDECHALAMHTLPDPDPEVTAFHRTKIGALVHRAKPYSLWSGDPDEALRLAARLEEFISTHPAYRRATRIFPAPASNKAKKFDLPSVMAKEIANSLDMKVGTVSQIRNVKPQKDVESLEALRENRRNSVTIDDDLSGETVVFLDDIYRSGQTLGDLVRAARGAGAKEVLCLTATKTMKFAQGLSL